MKNCKRLRLWALNQTSCIPLHYGLCHLLAACCDVNYFISPCLYFLFSKMLTVGLLGWLSG